MNDSFWDEWTQEPIETNAPEGVNQGVHPTKEKGEIGDENENDQHQTTPTEPIMQHPDLNSWKAVLYEHGQLEISHVIADNRHDAALIASLPLDSYVATLNTLRNNPEWWQTNDPLGLSATEIEEETHTVAEALIQWVHKQYGLPNGNGNGHKGAIMLGTQEQASVANTLYLNRPEVIERLGYAESIALMIGGKHHGKTTNIRTLALTVCRGLQIWERKTTQGPVLYMASDDEIASTRSELLAMGWRKDDPLRLGQINPYSNANIETVLTEIATEAKGIRAIMIVLDMLFDFAGIKNEQSYAETRHAIGLIQKLATDTKAFVICTHHTPKYLLDVHQAENAALGSQGIAARFSPIILSRKWANNLYTVESTTVRDPRGEPLKPIKVRRDNNGWIETVGEFKEWMKWEMYVDRIMAVFEGGDPSEGHSVYSIAEKLELNRVRVQNVLHQLCTATPPRLKREKHGYSYWYYLF